MKKTNKKFSGLERYCSGCGKKMAMKTRVVSDVSYNSMTGEKIDNSYEVHEWTCPDYGIFGIFSIHEHYDDAPVGYTGI